MSFQNEISIKYLESKETHHKKTSKKLIKSLVLNTILIKTPEMRKQGRNIKR